VAFAEVSAFHYLPQFSPNCSQFSFGRGKSSRGGKNICGVSPARIDQDDRTESPRRGIPFTDSNGILLLLHLGYTRVYISHNSANIIVNQLAAVRRSDLVCHCGDCVTQSNKCPVTTRSDAQFSFASIVVKYFASFGNIYTLASSIDNVIIRAASSSSECIRENDLLRL